MRERPTLQCGPDWGPAPAQCAPAGQIAGIRMPGGVAWRPLPPDPNPHPPTPATALVLDHDHAPIPGLFAAGELVGGVFYFNYPGGTGLMNGAVFGRLAGSASAG